RWPTRRRRRRAPSPSSTSPTVRPDQVAADPTRHREPAPRRAGAASGAALAVVLVLAAVNLRTAVASVPPLLDQIQDDLGLSGAAAGSLTTLPVVCMGLFA